MALLKYCLLYILLVVGSLLGLDLGGSVLRPILLKCHLILSWLILTLPPGQYRFSFFTLIKLETFFSRPRSLKTQQYELYHLVGTNIALLVYIFK